MKTDSTSEDRVKVGTDVAWLADNCRGPEQLRNRLKCWAQDYSQSHEEAFQYDRVEAALHALVTLAHSNFRSACLPLICAGGLAPRWILATGAVMGPA